MPVTSSFRCGSLFHPCRFPLLRFPAGRGYRAAVTDKRGVDEASFRLRRDTHSGIVGTGLSKPTTVLLFKGTVEYERAITVGRPKLTEDLADFGLFNTTWSFNHMVDVLSTTLEKTPAKLDEFVDQIAFSALGMLRLHFQTGNQNPG
jgi:hypothetical protein